MTTHSTPSSPDYCIKQLSDHLKREESKNVQTNNDINLNEKDENVELNISNLDNSVEIHEGK